MIELKKDGERYSIVEDGVEEFSFYAGDFEPTTPAQILEEYRLVHAIN